MSMNSAFDYGYGMYVDGVPDIKLLKVLADHTDTLNKMLGHEVSAFKNMFARHKDDGEDFDFYDVTEEDCNDMEEDDVYRLDDRDYEPEGPHLYFSILSAIINEEQGIRTDYSEGQSDIDSDPAIMVCCGMPWKFTKKERDMEEEDYHEIFSKYAKELGIPESEVGDVEVEYYG